MESSNKEQNNFYVHLIKKSFDESSPNLAYRGKAWIEKSVAMKRHTQFSESFFKPQEH